MKIGLYLFASLSMMIIVGILTYLVNPNHFSVSFLGLNITLSVAIWVMLPIAILIFFSVLHMLYYGTKNFFQLRKWRKDMDTLQENLYWSILQEPKESTYALPEMQESANILSHAKLSLDGEVATNNTKLDEAIKIAQEIHKGSYVDLKNKKIKKSLDNNNPLMIQNQLNKLEEDSKFITTVLQDKGSYNQAVSTKALEILVQKSNFVEAQKYISELNMNHFNTMLARVSQGEDLGLTPEVAKQYIEAMHFDCQDFVRVAVCISKEWTPDAALAFFGTLQQQNERAESAYLYLLFAYEMMSEIRDFFEANPENEFKKFKMFYALKQTQSGHKIEDLIDTNTLCDNA